MFKSLNTGKTLAILGLAGALAASAGGAFAQETKDTQWQKNHPRREQVNHRLAHQNVRIKDEVQEGDMSKRKAARLHKEDRQIRQEERDMAAQSGGHITKQEQKALNQQENAVSKKIGR
jgi:hypothetical protein